MAVTKEPAETLAEKVKHDLKTSTACQSTLSSLRALLGLELTSTTSKGCVKSATKAPAKTTRSAATQPTAKRPSATRTKVQEDFKIHDETSTSPHFLPLDRRRVFATETFNITLKKLGDRLKQRQNEGDGRLARSPAVLPVSPEKALQSRSPNRRTLAASSDQTGKAATGKSLVHQQDGSLESTAECAMVALQYLETAISQPDASSTDINSLLRGAQILLDKLIGLALLNQAVQQAWRNRSQLCSRMEHPVKAVPTNISLSCAISFEDLPSKADLLNLVINFQIQVLKVGCLLGTSFVDEALLRLLTSSNLSNPASLILRAVEMKLTTEDKAGQHLHWFSMLLSRLCSSLHKQKSNTLAPLAQSQLGFAMLALRCRSWRLLGHTPDLEKEFWVPLNRGLQAYEGTCKEDYAVIRQSIDDLQRLVELAGHDKDLPSHISTILIDLAQRSGSSKDALALLKEQPRSGHTSNGLAAVIDNCRIATVVLNDANADACTQLESCERASESLKLSLKGTASELRDLLLHSARLRKAAVAAALTIDRRIDSAQAGEDDIKLQNLLIRLVYAITRFVLRYAGQAGSQDKTLKCVDEPGQGQAAISNCARSTVDAVLSLMRCTHIRSAVLCEDTEAALRDCLELTSLLDSRITTDVEKAPRKQVYRSVFLRVSNIYWAWYLHEKEIGLSPKQLLSPLHSSVETLRECSREERRLGFAVVKYERLASVYQDLGDNQNMRSFLCCAINASIEQGALNEAVEIVLAGPARLAWTDPNLGCYALGSCLRKLGRASASHYDTVKDGETLYFDDSTFPDIHRAQVLEVQLFAMIEKQSTGSKQTTAVDLSQEILTLCQQPQHHVYRIRFIRDLLSLAAKHDQFPVNDILNLELIQAACAVKQPDVQSPSLLATYGPVLSLSVLLQWTFLTSRPSVECLRGLVTRIASLVSRCQNTAELEAIIDDTASLLRQLNVTADYAGILDLVDTRLAALTAMRQVLRHQRQPDEILLAMCLTQMGSASARLGRTADAGRSFAEAGKMLRDVVGHADTMLSWQLAYAEYLVGLDAHVKGVEMIEAAYVSYNKLMEQMDLQPHGSDRIRQESQLGHAALIVSRLDFSQGNLASAVAFARQCVKLTTGLWAALEKLFETATNRADAVNTDATLSKVEETLNTSVSFDQSSLQVTMKGASFWSHVHLHFQALLHMCTLSAHCGLASDAIHYASLASKVASALNSEQLQTKSRIKLTLLYARSGQCDQAKSIFKEIEISSVDHLPGFEVADALLELASIALTLGDLVTAKHYLDKVNSSLTQTSTPAVSVGLTDTASLNKQMATSAIDKRKAGRGTKPRSTVASAKTPPAQKTLQEKTDATHLGPDKKLVSPVIARLEEAKAVLMIQLQLRDGELHHSPSASLGQHPSDSKMVADASLLLKQAFAIFGSDAVHCVLAETASAFPSKYSARRPSGRVSALSATTMSKRAKKTTKSTQNTTQDRGIISSVKADPEDLLRKAYELMRSACAADASRSPSEVVHDAQKLFCRLSMLANAVGLALSYSPIKLVHNALKPKDIMLSRERLIMDADSTTTDKSQLRAWPVAGRRPKIVKDEFDAEQATGPTPEGSVLPETWSVVSVSLNDAKNELLLSRVTADAMPLILRIPLSRSAIDDADENQFTFAEAKEELVDIINQANLTAHDARSQGEKAARKLWWAQRETLDRRLETLLLNMENIWLGGFRGILSQQRKSDEGTLSRFSSSLDTAFDKHLPSRQKTGSTSKNKVRLHAHILELFIAFGHPDEMELDDAITDLLYFVVDILQFEGERNAYDEIDFDAILVDVLDALRSYHDACVIDNTPCHTILILDKELHAFPWETLPCLLGKSVSRMPSMGMVHDRLARIRAQFSITDAYELPSTSGAYILNPSSDLTSTHTTFSDTFTNQLPTFNSIIARKPSETEFESLLQTSPLLLYFGHGSGAQYIRGRRIKALSQCAVTFLMGCSSSKMNECGVYESHGMPWNYMHAGSMAVVGTLWDVTDRDIDRFALAALEEWGLLENVQEDEKTKKKTEARRRKVATDKAKPKKIDERKGKGQVALDEAVNRGKNACILRYLNGAAVVVYGVPVMLR